MKLDKYDRMFIAFMFIIVTVVSICNTVRASETEDVEFTTVTGMAFDSNTNHFVTGISGRTTGYFQLEKGYVYYIHNNSTDTEQYTFLATSNELPANNVPLTNIGRIYGGETYSYLATDTGYLYFAFSNSYQMSVTREKVEGQEGAINELVENVGVSQLWGVFESGIDFVGVIVLCAFGFFLVFLLIKKITKGKSDF